MGLNRIIAALLLLVGIAILVGWQLGIKLPLGTETANNQLTTPPETGASGQATPTTPGIRPRTAVTTNTSPTTTVTPVPSPTTTITPVPNPSTAVPATPNPNTTPAPTDDYGDITDNEPVPALW